MRKKNAVLLTMIAGVILLSLIPQSRGTAVGTHTTVYELDWYVIGSGGTINSEVGKYSLNATIGQNLAGQLAASNIVLNVGFWFQRFFDHFLPVIMR